MNKYINADQFERDCMFDKECEDMQDVIYKLRDYPSADVVKVVRCKKCEYYRSYYDMFKPYYDSPITEDEMHSGQCNYIGKRTGVYMEVNENDYCSYGERRKTNG